MTTTTNQKVYESSNGLFALKGNGQCGNVIRSGWKESRLGEAKRTAIINAFEDSLVDQIYRRGNKIYATLLNGLEKQIF